MVNKFKLGKIEVEPGTRVNKHYKIAKSPDGQDITIPLIIINGKHDGPVLYLGGATHGDELEGTLAIIESLKYFNPEKLNGTILASPLTSAAAATTKIAHEASGMRESPIDFKNPMRIFPGKENGTTTERIVWVVGQEFLPNCDYALELHSGGQKGTSIQMAGFCDVPGEFGRKSYELASSFTLPYLWSIPLGDPDHPGRLQEVAREKNVPICVSEVCGMGIQSDEDVSAYVDSINNVLKYLEMISGETKEVPENRPVVGVEEYVYAEEGGLFIPELSTGEKVKKGQKVGVIVDVWGQEIQNINSPLTGIVTGLRIKPIVWPGEPVFLAAEINDRGENWPK